MPDTLTSFDQQLLDAAIKQAEKSWAEGGIPIGAALGDPASGEIVSTAHNMRVQSGDSTAHAEMSCIRNAGRRRDWHKLHLASTLSPCIMCTGACILHRIPRVIIGENTTYMGAEDLMHQHNVQLVHANDQRCIELMTKLQNEKPDLWNEDIGIPEDE